MLDRHAAIQQLLSEGKRLVIFGTGEMSKMVKLVPDYYVDNDASRWNRTFKGRSVHGPHLLEQEDKDRIVVVVASQFYGDIAAQLAQMGFVEYVHVFPGQALFEEAIRRNYVFRTKRCLRRWMRRGCRRFRGWDSGLINAWKRWKRTVKRAVTRCWSVLRQDLLIVFPPALGSLPVRKRRVVIRRMRRITKHVHCPHTEGQVIEIVDAILRLPPERAGCIVEAGSYRGGSTAKLSIAAKVAGRELYVFDSFQGLPDNNEPHERNIFGRSIRGWFTGGQYRGTLDEVRSNVTEYGEIDVCHFIQGWFEDTMPAFDKPIAVAFLDVDLASSTRTCLKYLYPLLIPGGVLFSHDGAFPLVIDVLNDDRFWEDEVGFKKPVIEGLGVKQLIKIVKP